MHIDPTVRRAYNIEPNMCWECYSCVKACPHHAAIDVRGYADFAPPLGPLVRSDSRRRERRHAWRIKSRNGETDLNLLAPITTKPWGSTLSQACGCSWSQPGNAQQPAALFNEPKYIRMDDGDIHTLKSNGLEMKAGVYY